MTNHRVIEVEGCTVPLADMMCDASGDHWHGWRRNGCRPPLFIVPLVVVFKFVSNIVRLGIDSEAYDSEVSALNMAKMAESNTRG